ncbi:MAG: integral rane sensor signal transduction histidine kinase, partial [Labilithrix sp.]|nr:integral rane sensor signal transduction histidine kinase [Labilithrix sp.]
GPASRRQRGGDLTPPRLAVAALGVLAGAGNLVVSLRSDVDPPFFFTPYLGLLVGWSFVGGGLIAWSRRADRPERRIGAVMVALGFAWFAAGLTRVELAGIATLGSAVSGLWTALAIYLLLVFPDGRLKTRLDHLIAAAIVIDTVVLQLVFLVFSPTIETGADNAFVLWSSQSAADWIAVGQQVLLVAVAIAVLGVFAERWQSASPPLRRALAPVYCAGGATLLLITATLLVTRLAGADLPGAADVGRAMFSLTLVALAAVPLAFLAGLVRARLARLMVGELLVELRESRAPGALRDALARVLHDPSLEIVYWLPDHRAYVGMNGDPINLPAEGSGRATTVVEHNGTRVAVLIHDPSLRDDPELVAAACSAAGIAVDNERLHADLRTRLGELRRSRLRVMEAADAERRRLERNLHDGAQQGLATLAVELAMLAEHLESDPEAKRLLAHAQDELAGSLDELRELARGIHPAVLTDHGLAVALDALAERSPFPVRLAIEPGDGLPERIEVAGFYLISECLANTAKYAEASEAVVAVSRENDRVIIEVVDDGVGGASRNGGSGLRGLTDRVEALGGKLELSSPSGRGTRVRAEIPCGDVYEFR